MLDLVTSLVARSLVVAEDRGLATRYRLLETIRQYAEERLAETDEAETLLMRHARFYADLSVTAGEYSYGPEQIASAKQVSLERENIRVAFATALDVRDAALAVRLVANHRQAQSHAVTPMGAGFGSAPDRHLLAGCARAFADDRPEVAAPYWVRGTSPSDGQGRTEQRFPYRFGLQFCPRTPT